jgi:predicted nuclease of predicted toxin-antitoxin system
MAKNQTTHMKQKLRLYFDENFPLEIVELLNTAGYWQKRCKVYSAKSEGNENRDDMYHYQFCKKHGFVLVTLDKDFMNDRQYPITSSIGIIRVVARNNET